MKQLEQVSPRRSDGVPPASCAHEARQGDELAATRHDVPLADPGHATATEAEGDVGAAVRDPDLVPVDAAQVASGSGSSVSTWLPNTRIACSRSPT